MGDLASVAVWLGSGANTYVSGEVISLTVRAQPEAPRPEPLRGAMQSVIASLSCRSSAPGRRPA